jgi:Protein of unknown function (DUF3995)
VARAAAYGSAALAWAYALVSAYWTAGGTALLATVGGQVEDLARRGGSVAVLVGVLTVAVKLAGGLLGPALVRPEGRRLPRRALRACALAGGGLLTLYGAANVVLGGLGLFGVFGEPADRTALRWHVGVWDLWFLLWGVLLLMAVRFSPAGTRPEAGHAHGPEPRPPVRPR